MLFDVLNVSDVVLCAAIFGTVILGLKTLAPIDLGAEVSADFEALSDSDEEINSFESVKVVKVENNQIYIKKGV